MDETCQRTVPEAIIAFLESQDFEDAIRNAVSLGGDTDTLGAITGSIAEAFYGISDVLIAECRSLSLIHIFKRPDRPSAERHSGSIRDRSAEYGCG